MVLQTYLWRESLPQIEYIKLIPSVIANFNGGYPNRPVSKWLRSNGISSITKKVVFWGIRKSPEYQSLFAVTFGLTDGEVSEMISIKKETHKADNAYIVSYSLGKEIPFPEIINEIGDDLDPELDDLLFRAGEGDFAYLALQINQDGTPAAMSVPELNKEIRRILNIPSSNKQRSFMEILQQKPI
jgi:hypothetical protein